MFPKIFIIFIGFFIIISHTQAQNNNQIEIFDIEKRTIIKTIPTNPDIQSVAGKFLSEIKDLYKNINPIPKKGFMVKIPLDPSIKVHNQWINDLIDEVIIIFPIEGSPYIMTYDDQNNTYFFTINNIVNADILLKKMDFSALPNSIFLF
ncbi:hypothetical protein BGM26_16030 [Bacillus sp. FJAT-29790]|uniref:hypothetical protein n=1 Tax=Bacillus sp. FJAT-29790 TaxID=1895002 RepID=UPI001C2222B3|nr:hypothetical protein [Bacillus sp. FJAT-29790]MBU8880463.1 hypothetical protein [Bacillus sp. FJAT-29790]